MDAAVVLLLIFLVYSVLVGFCLARVRGLVREVDELRQVVAVLGRVQRDTSLDAASQGSQVAPVLSDSDLAAMLTPEVLAAARAMQG